MSTEPAKSAIIECLVEDVGNAVITAGFSAGRHVTLQVRYLDQEEVIPSGFIYIEGGSNRMLSGVTLETMPQAIARLGLGPDDKFTVIIEDDTDIRGGE